MSHHEDAYFLCRPTKIITISKIHSYLSQNLISALLFIAKCKLSQETVILYTIDIYIFLFEDIVLDN